MPRNRSDVARDVKVGEILAVAGEILNRDGFAGLSLADVARRLGLARAAVYWYFPTKDDLLVAVVGAAFAEFTDSTPAPSDGAPGGDPVDRLLVAVDRLAELQPLATALHDRAHHAEQAARLEARIQEDLCARLRNLLTGHVPATRLDLVARGIVVFVEGLLTHSRTAAERRELTTFLARRLIDDP